jgi:hypothetical protein
MTTRLSFLWSLLVGALILIGGCGGGGGDGGETHTRTVRVEVSSSAPVQVSVSVSEARFEAQTPIVRDVTVRVPCSDNDITGLDQCKIVGSAVGPLDFSGTLTLCLEDSGQRECQTGTPLVFVVLDVFL